MISDPDQEAILDDRAHRLLIEAPPGSGKTRTAVRLIGRDVNIGLVNRTQRVLVLTFSRNARSQLEGYAAQLLSPEQRARAEITNYHAWFWSKVSQYRTSLGLPLDVELVSDAERKADVTAAMAAEGLPVDPRDGQQLSDYMRAPEFELAEGRPERLREPRPKSSELAARLLDVHKRTGRLHYDDLAYYTWRLVAGSSTLRRIWRHKYPVIILDEYQDASPLQAAIVERLATPRTRVYAFADPLQQIYTWRDASKQRLRDFRTTGPSEHRLRTLHRYRHRLTLQRWMEQARDVLLDDATHITAPRPPEIRVEYYDASQPERGKVWDAEARELFQLNRPISRVLTSPDDRTVAVLSRNHRQLHVLERHLTRLFRCSRLRATEDALDFALTWVSGYARATTAEHHAARLLDVAHRVAPRHNHLDFEARLGHGGIDTARLREPRRTLATEINDAATRCETLTASFRSALRVARLACEGQDRRVIDWPTFRALSRALRAPAHLPDPDAAEHARTRIRQARFAMSTTPRRGLYLMSCHEGKGKEFDLVVLPYVSANSFKDDEESRQLLYVSLTRARHHVLVRIPSGGVPPICERLGLA